MSTRRLPRKSIAAVGAEAHGPAAGQPFKHRNLPLLLLQARECVISRFRPMLNAQGVTEQQWRILRALQEHGALEPRQIVSRCHISSPSLAGVLARMDELGLVQRARLPHDQRRLMVSLTDAGRHQVATMAPQIEALYQTIEAHIGADFIDDLYAALDDLIDKMAALPAEEGDRASSR